MPAPLQPDPEYVLALQAERAMPPQAVRALYQAVGCWPERSPAEIGKILYQDVAVGVWAGDRLVAFARAISDGQFRAYIEDVAVHPEHRGRGLGRRLLNHLVETLSEIDVISLFCEKSLANFYKPHGFQEGRDQIVMHLQKRG